MPPHDGLTRRRFLASVAASAGLLTACGSGTEPAASTGGNETVTVDAANGTVEVPVTTGNIWALDEYSALQLLALGVVPDHAGKRAKDVKVQAILADAGVELVEPSKPELIAAADPALIVGGPTDGLLTQLEQSAPWCS